MNQSDKDQTAKDLMHLLLKWYYPDGTSAKNSLDYLRRGLNCTPFVGGYGKNSGWVICVNGSPPKGTLVVFGEGPPGSGAYYLGGKCKTVSGLKQGRMIKRFAEVHLKGQQKGFALQTSLLFST